MKQIATCVAIIVGLLTGAAFGQAIPGQTPQQPDRPDQPRGNGGGIGGIGLSIKLGGKKKPPPLPPGPALEMRDVDVAEHLPDQVIFVINGQSSAAAKIARAAKVTIIETTYLNEPGLTMVVAQLAPGDTPALAQARLEKISGVSWAQPNYQFQLLGNSLPRRFALHAIPEKQPSVSGRIVMIDAAVDMGHQNLKGAALTQSFFGVAPTPAVHGTVVAALLAGTGTYPGIAKGATLTSLAAFGPSAAGASLSRTSYLARAMNEASRLRPDVLNLSFGGPVDRLLGVMLDTIFKNGVCVSAAAGNGGPTGKILFPATHPASLAVTAVDEKLRGYAYASQGTRIDVAGVGVGLNAAVPGGRRAVSGQALQQLLFQARCCACLPATAGATPPQ